MIIDSWLRCVIIACMLFLVGIVQCRFVQYLWHYHIKPNWNAVYSGAWVMTQGAVFSCSSSYYSFPSTFLFDDCTEVPKFSRQRFNLLSFRRPRSCPPNLVNYVWKGVAIVRNARKKWLFWVAFDSCVFRYCSWKHIGALLRLAFIGIEWI